MQGRNFGSERRGCLDDARVPPKGSRCYEELRALTPLSSQVHPECAEGSWRACRTTSPSIEGRAD